MNCCQCSKNDWPRTPATPGCLSCATELASQWSDGKTQVADYTAAIDALSQPKAEATTANLKRLHERRGNAYVALKQWQQAVDDYARAVTDATTDDALLSNQALALAEVLLSSKRGTVKRTDPWQRLAAAYQLNGDRRAIAQLVERRPKLAGPVGDLFTQEPNQNWQRAVELYNKGITGNRSDADLLSRRARDYEALKNWDAAAADWSRAATGNPDGAKLLAEFARRLAAGDQVPLANGRLKVSSTLRTIAGRGP